MKKLTYLLLLCLTVATAPARSYDLIQVVNLARDLSISGVAMARGAASWPAPYGPVQPAAQSLAEDAQRFHDMIRNGASADTVRDEFKRVSAKFSRLDSTFKSIHQQVNDANAGSAFHTVRYHYCALRGMIYPAMQLPADEYDECRG